MPKADKTTTNSYYLAEHPDWMVTRLFELTN